MAILTCPDQAKTCPRLAGKFGMPHFALHRENGRQHRITATSLIRDAVEQEADRLFVKTITPAELGRERRG
ncbi:hypothetical protein D3C71_2175860 [compost metagenome]